MPDSSIQLSLYSSVAWQHPLGLGFASQIAKAAGYEAISIRGRSTDIHNPGPGQIQALGYDMLSPTSVDDEGIAALKKLLSESAIRPYCLSTYASLVEEDAQTNADSLERIHTSLAFAARLEIPVLRTIGHIVPTQLSPDARRRALARMVRNLQDVCTAARGLGVEVQIENTERAIPRTYAESNEVLDHVGADNLSLAFDPVNGYFTGLDPLSELDGLDKPPAAIHVKNIAKINNGFAWRGVPDGDLDWRGIVGNARDKGFDGTLVCEYVNPYKAKTLHGWGQLPAPMDWARETAAYLRDLLP